MLDLVRSQGRSCEYFEDGAAVRLPRCGHARMEWDYFGTLCEA
ncbi:hypothetical protein [Streptomyces sp. NPDC002187]